MKGITNFCLTPEGNVLVCCGRCKLLVVVSPEGKVIEKWSLDVAPDAVHVGADGAIYVGGGKKMPKLSGKGALGRIESGIPRRPLLLHAGPDRRMYPRPPSVARGSLS